MTGLPEMDANDALFLNGFQQQYRPQLNNQGNSMDQHRGNSSLDSSLLGCDPTPIGTMNINRSVGQQQTPQQLYELMQAMSREQNGLGFNLNNNNNGNNNALLQQQFLQLQQQLAVNTNNSMQMQNQNQQRLQLANLLGNQQLQNGMSQRQHSLSLVNMEAPQQRHSLSLGMGDGGVNALLAFQLRNQQTGNNNADPQGKASAAANNTQKKQQKEFLLFIKILLKCLATTQNHLLKERTKQIVAECTKRNRLGDPAYMPLQAAVEQRLRPVVGEKLWTRAQSYVQSYNSKQPQLAQQAARVRQQQQQQLQQQAIRIARC